MSKLEDILTRYFMAAEGAVTGGNYNPHTIPTLVEEVVKEIKPLVYGGVEEVFMVKEKYDSGGTYKALIRMVEQL